MISQPDLFSFRSKLEKQEKTLLSAHGCYSTDAMRRHQETVVDHRLSFSVDCDRIIHSKSYARYIDKTQVFHLINNDHITHRGLHVQLVSKIGRTIGRFLSLNQDLIEAIALGHDIGHPPFGHEGEAILSSICQQHNIGPFLHNIQSVRFLDCIEKKGNGLNLTLQTLDGVLCHDGEVHSRQLSPSKMKTFVDFDREIIAKMENIHLEIMPMTLEGCVVRIADTIAYIGRDIEDAIELKIIKREEIPVQCRETLGSTNGKIVYYLVTDLIKNSINQNSLSFSPQTSKSLAQLKRFNYQHIYFSPFIKKGLDKISKCYIALFESYLTQLESGKFSSTFFNNFTKDRTQDYLTQNSPSEIVRDCIAGMTDDYFLNQAKLIGCILPENK